MKAAAPFSSPVVVSAVVFVVVVVVVVVVVTGALLHARSCSIVDDRMLQEMDPQTLFTFSSHHLKQIEFFP